jgi:hypothetical protein
MWRARSSGADQAFGPTLISAKLVCGYLACDAQPFIPHQMADTDGVTTSERGEGEMNQVTLGKASAGAMRDVAYPCQPFDAHRYTLPKAVPVPLARAGPLLAERLISINEDTHIASHSARRRGSRFVGS